VIDHEYHPIAEKYWTGLRCCCDLGVAARCYQHEEVQGLHSRYRFDDTGEEEQDAKKLI
jgi:hypothetical protein